jgi:CBS domain containing-hemolysin-like protein
MSHAQGNSDNNLEIYRRDIPVLPDTSSLQVAFEFFLEKRSHIMLIVDEYGSMSGILTLEDILETILGIEIVDESDHIDDMRKLARRLWIKRANKMGLKVDKEA